MARHHQMALRKQNFSSAFSPVTNVGGGSRLVVWVGGKKKREDARRAELAHKALSAARGKPEK